MLAATSTSGAFSSITGNFDGSAIPAGTYVWFSSVLQADGLGGAPVRIFLRDSRITFTANELPIDLRVPDATITFSPAVSAATTTFDPARNEWFITVPSNTNRHAFLSGLAFLVPMAGIPGGHDPVTWQGSFYTDTPGVSLRWKWAGAPYSAFSRDYRTLGVKPIDGMFANPYPNADNAGTPEFYKGYLLGGAGSGGGAKYVGSYSPTGFVTPVVEVPNRLPVANAGPDQTLYVTNTAQLDGSGSSDLDGDPLTYSWSFVSRPTGSSATLSDANSVSPSFVIDKPGNYTARLVVSDGRALSSPDYVVIGTLNSAPVANAGPDQTATTGSLVRLDGSASTDVDGDGLTYRWTMVQRPPDSSAVLDDVTAVRPTFTADRKGAYVVRLVVRDAETSSTPDDVVISTVNSAPVANAGADQSILVGTAVQLNGSGSTDVDGDALAYRWTLISVPEGSQAQLSSGTDLAPTFTADVLGTYVVQLVVNDGDVDSAPDSAVISTENTAPVADAGPDQSVALGSLVRLDGSASNDADGQLITYEWALLSMPAGSTAVLSDPAAPDPNFTVDRAGDYIAQLTVSDGYVRSTPDTVVVSTINSVPVANAGPDQKVLPGSTVQLAGAASSDADEDPLTYSWAFLSQPAGSDVPLSDVTSATPTFVPSVEGYYVAQLIVSDGKVQSAPDTVLITVEGINAPPVADAGPDQTIQLPATTVNLSGSATDDGRPLDSSLSYTWTQVSGPGATIADAASASTQVTLTEAGTYVFRLSVSDSDLTSDDEVTVVLLPENQAPVVSAGASQSITLPVNSVTLSGSVTDDGKPQGSVLSSMWTQLSGPAGVVFSEASQPVTQATFPAVGTYVLELSATDGELSGSAPTTVTVLPQPVNQAPGVSAGPDRGLTLPNTTVSLNGSVTDDGLPNGSLAIQWSQVSGPSSVVFSDPDQAVTQATLDAAGTYTLRLSASDGQYTSSSDVRVVVFSPNSGENHAPFVDAGPNQFVVLPNTATLQGTVADDGLPNGTLQVVWEKISGPGTVTFANASSASTTAAFGQAGTYVLRLSASDSQLIGSADVTITVTDPQGRANSSGTDFWLLFHQNFGLGPNTTLTLFVTGESNTTGTVTIPGVGTPTQFRVTAGQITSIPIPYSVMLTNSEAIENKGIHLVSESPVTVYGLNQQQYTTDGFLALPTTMLGTEYVNLAYRNMPSGLTGSELGIVATRDNTTVTVTPSFATGGRAAGTPYSFVLHRGRTYLLRNTVDYLPNQPADLSGSIITADKPIAVFGGNQCVVIPTPGIGACDHIVEQLPPVKSWGRTFATVPLATRAKGDTLRVLAATDGTRVSLNGGEVTALLDRGELLERIITTPTSIEADQPVLVAQYANSSGWDGTTGDPFFVLVPPRDGFSAAYTLTTPASGFALNFLNVIVSQEASGTVKLDGTLIPESSFTAIPGGELVGAQLPISVGTHRLESQQPIGAIAYGFATFESYGYPASIAAGSVPDGAIELLPETALRATGAQHCLTATARDTFGDPLGAIAVDFIVTGANPVTGRVVTNRYGQAQFCYASSAAGSDSIKATVGSYDGAASVSWQSGAGNQPPFVFAGDPQTVPFGGVAILAGQANDDGLPQDTLTATWTKVSGPGTVTFSAPSSATGQATFSAAGTYVLRLTASDGDLSDSSDLTISVLAITNQAPVVSAGPNQTLDFTANPSGTVTLNGSATDDGVPAGALLQYNWQLMVGSPADVTLGDPTAPVTTVTIRPNGSVSTYTFRLTADDSLASGSATVTVTTVPSNKAPLISFAGTPSSITLPTDTATLKATVTDDGKPAGGTLTLRWSQRSGPAPVTFASPDQAITQATFPVAGSYSVQLTANDGELQSVQVLNMFVNPANRPPTVLIPTPPPITLPANTVTLNPTVTDDGLPNNTLTYAWTQLSGPSPAAFSAPDQKTTQVQFSTGGIFGLQLTVSDGQYTAAAAVSVTVNPTGGTGTNNPPTISGLFAQTITLPNATATFNATVTDDGKPAGSTVSVQWTQDSGPALATISSPNSPSTTVTCPVAGSYTFRLTASDTQFTASQVASVTVRTNTQPSVTVSGPASVVLPNTAALTSTVNDDGLPNNTLTYAWSQVAGPVPAVFSAPAQPATLVTFPQAGTYQFRLTVSDGQLYTFNGIGITVLPETPPPAVAITSPADGAEITKPADVIGTIEGAVTWKLEYALNSDDDPANRTWVLLSSTATVNKLGTLDPTLLLNGNYTLRLTATDAVNRSTSTSIAVTVNKNMKVGVLSLAFKDLDVALSGLPIQLLRGYDSRDRRKGDFGVGWTLLLKSARLEKNRNLGRQWEETVDLSSFFPQYCVQPVGERIVTITFPDGRVYKFRAKNNKVCQVAAPIQVPSLAFEQLPSGPGTAGATLAPADGASLLFSANVPGVVDLVDFNTNVYNPTLFRLRTAEGYTYLIDQKLGVTSVTDPNGNTLTINANGITSSTGVGISFVRDAQGRITQITDPNGKPLTYTYDAAGNLATFTDAENKTTRFTYLGAQGQLSGIIDARNIQVLNNSYDLGGRLISTTDALGKTVFYTHDVPGQRETVKDRNGNSTVYEYDAAGNVTRVTDALNGVSTYTYDANDNKLSETDPLGHTTRYTYDLSGNRTSETDPLGNVTRYAYNGMRQVTSVTDPLGRKTTNTYDFKGNLLSTKDPLGATTTYTYDGTGNPTSVTDALNHATTFTYDAAGRLRTQTDALGNVTTFTYDANGNKLTQAVTRTVNGSPETLTTTYTYDNQNRLTKTTNPDGTFTQVQYNAIGKQSATIDALLRTTSYAYDTDGRLTTTTYPDTRTELTGYDNEGRRTSSTDRGGHVTRYAYDALGRLTRTTFADNTFTETAYDAAGRVATTRDQRGNVTTYGYDDAGRRTSVTDALGKVTTFAYDAAGNQTSVTDANNHTTTFEYDAAGRRTKVTYHDGTFETTAYDALGRVTSKTDQAGKTTQYGYDALGRLTSVTDALNQVTSYTYDELGNRLTQTDANQHTTSFTYDKLGRRLTRALPLGQSESYTYDANGNLKTRTDFNGRTTTYNYDNLNRLTSKVPDAAFAAPTVSFTYTFTGKRQTMTDVNGQTTYTYDAVMERLVAKQTPQSGKLNYAYDTAGNLTSITSTNANGAAMTYTYDALNRLATVTDSSGVTNYSYDNVGNLASFTYPNGVQHSYTYNTLNRLTTLLVQSAAQGPQSSYAYTLGPAGNRTGVTELSGRTVSYGYDNLYRLTSETIAGGAAQNGTISYTYDPVGNRTQLTSTVAAIPSSGLLNYDANDRLAPDVYDSNGNTTSSGGIGNTYDFENHLIQHGAVTVVYDGDGNRVSKTAGGVTTKYLVSDVNPTGYVQVMDELVSGAVQRRYSYGLDLLSETQKIGGVFQTSFYSYDGHGSVRQLTNTAGNVTDTYTYDAFGNLIEQTGTAPNLYLYAGEQFDPDLGLYYNRARYLDVRSGRFWGMDEFEGDPESPLSLHKYVYAHNDPVGYLDSSGNAEFSVAGQTFNVTIANVLRGIAVSSFKGALTGAIIGGTDAALGGDDVIQGALQGAAFGAIFGPFARIRVAAALLGLFGFAVGGASGIDAIERGNTAQGFFRLGLAVFSAVAAVRTIAAILRTPGTAVRAPTDIARQSDYPEPPAANAKGSIGGGPAQQAALDRDTWIAKLLGGQDIRVNQEQVNAEGVRVGRNRPDLQFTIRIFSRIRIYIEYDPADGGRGAAHQGRILSNDPGSIVILRSF